MSYIAIWVVHNFLWIFKIFLERNHGNMIFFMSMYILTSISRSRIVGSKGKLICNFPSNYLVFIYILLIFDKHKTNSMVICRCLISYCFVWTYFALLVFAIIFWHTFLWDFFVTCISWFICFFKERSKERHSVGRVAS